MAQLEQLMMSGEQLSHRDKQVLREIRKNVAESLRLASSQRGYHARQLRREMEERA